MFSLRSKILAVALILLAFLSGAFVFYSRRTTMYYKQLRLDKLEILTAYEKEKINNSIAAIEYGAVSMDWGIEEIISGLSEIRPRENSFTLLFDPDNDRIIAATYAGINTGDAISGTWINIYAPSIMLDGIFYINFNQKIDNG